MAILKNTTINDTGFLTLPSGTFAQRPASPTTGMARFNTSVGFAEYYDGTFWRDVSSNRVVADGSTSTLAAQSAADIKYFTGTTTDGVYWINLPTVGPTEVYCLMANNWVGGGWMMVMKATRGTTFNYSSNYWTTSNTLNPTQLNRNDGDAKFNTFNHFPSEDIMAVWPDIGAGGSIPGMGAWTWLEPNFNGGAKIKLLDFFNNTTSPMYNAGSGQFMRDAKIFSGWASGVFSSQVDIRFYGFNYAPNSTNAAKVRWGFGWNENGEGLYPGVPSAAPGSNDVSGGIGMDSTFGSYSAGDRINCCQDTTGINRTARVEVYVR